jgi:hypothetical protein
MRTYTAARLHIARPVLSIVLVGSCLLTLGVLLSRASRAADSSPGEPVRSPIVLAAPALQAGGTYTQFMPLVARSYGALVNGSFEQGLAGWKTERGPFQGYGSGLPSSAVALSSGHAALLGSTSGTNGTILVGYGTLYQPFVVRERYLRFRYWVYSHDVAYSNGRYYDTFEVSINRRLPDIVDVERNSRGCSGAALNPQGLLAVPANGLVFCGGQPGIRGGNVSPWDTGGWRTVTLDLNAYSGQWVTLFLGLWSREYALPYIADQAWHNTWAYVDDVHFSSSASAADAGEIEVSADLPSPYLPADALEDRPPENGYAVAPPR